MLIAQDESGNRITTDQAVRGAYYCCPLCHHEVFLRAGEINIAHFAHKHKCTDTWTSDMSIWHSNWQNRFPVEMLEIVKESENQKHRADVLIENKKVVIEFQHSPISKEEFDERTAFYNSLGYRVIWVFDVADAYTNNLFCWEGNRFMWNHPKRILRNLDGFDMELFLQIDRCHEDDDDYLETVRKQMRGGSAYDSEEQFMSTREYLRKHRKNQNRLIRVVNWADECFPKLVLSHGDYDELSFVNLALNYQNEEFTYGHGYQTYLYLLAKEIISEGCDILLPPVEYDKEEIDCSKLESEDYRTIQTPIRGSYILRADSVELEKTIDNVISDIKLYYKEKPLLVEINVIHRIGGEKWEKIREAGISAIEFNLCAVNRVIDKGFLRSIFESGKYCHWIFNKKGSDKTREFMKDAEKRFIEKRLAEQRIHEEEKNEGKS